MKTIKAVLREGEEMSLNGYEGLLTKYQQFDFRYDEHDNFFIIIDGKEYEEAGTAFDFVEMPFNYYAEQLASIKSNGEYGSKVKITGEGDEATKWLSINDESATEIVKWLTQNFTVTRPVVDGELVERLFMVEGSEPMTLGQHLSDSFGWTSFVVESMMEMSVGDESQFNGDFAVNVRRVK